jgi:hypothetical protein
MVWEGSTNAKYLANRLYCGARNPRPAHQRTSAAPQVNPPPIASISTSCPG